MIKFYLDRFIFPIICRHQGMKISSSGQALGGNLLFNRRLGFSGTPSNLLPLEFGKCAYEKGSAGKMLYFLTSPEVMFHYLSALVSTAQRAPFNVEPETHLQQLLKAPTILLPLQNNDNNKQASEKASKKTRQN